MAKRSAKSLNSLVGKSSRFSAEKERSMQSKLANGMIGVGAIGILLGFIIMLSSRGEHPDSTILMMGACALSLGALLTAGGMYLKTKYLQASLPAKVMGKVSARRTRGCDICHGDAPIIYCRVHQVNMCSDCTGEHFDPRSCNYIPSRTRQVQRPVRGTAARAGA